MTTLQLLLMIIAVALATMITRFTPFFVFPETKTPPALISYLGKVLPSAMMGLLVVYCLKDVQFTSGTYGIAEIVSIASLVIIHRVKNNVFLSIIVSTIIYMVLLRFI